MKKTYKILIAFIGVLAVSCNADDVENRPVIDAGTAPVVTPLTDFSIVLSKETEKDTVTTVKWEKATYSGEPTIVNYTIQVAAAGTNFTVPLSVASTTDVSKVLTVQELNAALVNGGFPVKVEADVDVRIKSVVGANGLPQYSNIYTIKATPYHIPLASSHWLVGGATPGGWSWEGDNETEFPLVVGQSDVFQVTLVLKNGETFREFLKNDFTASNDNYKESHNFAYYKEKDYAIDAELENAGDGDSNFKYTGPTGPRVFKIDNVAKTITLD